jgi:hypothetical protein
MIGLPSHAILINSSGGQKGHRRERGHYVVKGQQSGHRGHSELNEHSGQNRHWTQRAQ